MTPRSRSRWPKTAKHRLGWIPDLPDQRDLTYSARPRAALPPKVDLRTGGMFSAVYDQGSLGSCTAQAIAAMNWFVQAKMKARRVEEVSRLFIYYGERVLENSVNVDAGATIRNGMKVLAKQGAPPERLWSYNVARFAIRPPKGAYSEALRRQALKYERIVGIQSMKACLAEGYPFVFGFSVYDSFESDAVARTGMVPMPTKQERLLGGHAVLAVGYDDAREVFICRNSWGCNWGDKGYFHLPYGFFTDSNLSDDFWTLRLLETP